MRTTRVAAAAAAAAALGVACGLDVRGTSSGAAADGGNADATPAEASTDAGALDAAPSGPCTRISCGARAICAQGSCESARRVFVSSTSSTANLGGVSGADARCQTLATAAALGGTWQAWVSDALSSPSIRFAVVAAPLRLIDGTVIAADWTALVTGDGLAHAIDQDEFGAHVAAADVWTSTTQGGVFTGYGGCLGHTSESLSQLEGAWVGVTDRPGTSWTIAYAASCNQMTPRVYCFEQ
jgi:hypothetical protein